MRNVLITGASRGIGAAAARLFAENGDRVFLNYRHSQEAVRKLCEELTAQGGEVYPIQADVSDSQAVKTMFDTLHSNGISIDVLVNNAGMAQTKLFTDLTDEDWHTMINTNLSSVFYCCRAALPDMIRRHNGRIINITSIWGQIGGSCEVHYSAAKAGIIGLTKALAKEEGLSGITVNAVAPGVIQTDMLSPYTAEDLQALRDETPTGTLGTPEDVARAVLFLASPDSAFITGQVLGINGGMV